MSAFQLGIGLVPLMAGLALNAAAPITTVAWIGAALAALTIPVALAERATSRRETTHLPHRAASERG